MTPLEMVRQFHEVFGCTINERDDYVIEGRLRLIAEEYIEVQAELIDFTGDEDEVAPVNPDPDFQAVAKELADLVYVVYGTAVAFGIDLDKAVALVHESNMSKLDPDGKPILREDGKVLKGPNYKPPAMDAVV